MDDSGALFNITADRGQHQNVSGQHPEIAAQLKTELNAYRLEMRALVAAHQERPFTVGYAPTTTLPARDGIPHGTIQRSAKAPNNSFFKNWTREDDSITWDIEVGTAGNYRATVRYTCPEANVGTTVRLSFGDATSEVKVTEAFDPPLWDKSKERVSDSHYFVKDFKPLDLGVITLPQGRSTLSLTCPQLVNGHGVDVYSIILDQVP